MMFVFKIVMLVLNIAMFGMKIVVLVLNIAMFGLKIVVLVLNIAMFGLQIVGLVLNIAMFGLKIVVLVLNTVMSNVVMHVLNMLMSVLNIGLLLLDVDTSAGILLFGELSRLVVKQLQNSGIRLMPARPFVRPSVCHSTLNISTPTCRIFLKFYSRILCTLS